MKKSIIIIATALTVVGGLALAQNSNNPKQTKNIKDNVKELNYYVHFYGALCERIKNTPLLRQYDYNTRVFLYMFILILPLSLIGAFTKMVIDFWMIPIAIIITFVFASIGKVNEDPFENKITDIPMTAMCSTIERDLKEMLGEAELPTKLEPEKGFLF